MQSTIQDTGTSSKFHLIEAVETKIIFFFSLNSLELQKKMPWFCIHEPNPSDTASQASNKTVASNEPESS